MGKLQTILAVVAITVFAACSDPVQPTTAATFQPAPISNNTPTASPAPTNTATATATPVPTSTPEPTATATSTQVPTETLVPTATPSPTATPEPTATPLPTATPTPTPTPAPLKPTQIFDLVSPSIAFIETNIASGSGVLIEGGYIVTNAHVVWPFRQARIVFPDGSEFLDTPVVGWDQLSDLAVLGPIEAEAEPLALVDGEDVTIGSDTYLIGYPAEDEEFPQPTITRGLVSRIREWESAGITFFQTDAAITGGQSGGALVSDRGEVIGISEFRFTDAGFGLVESAADLMPLINGIIAGESVSDVGDRDLMVARARKKHTITIKNDWDVQAFVLNEPPETDVEIEVHRDEGLALLIADVFGEIIFFDLTGGGVSTVSFETLVDAPYFVLPLIFESEGEITLESSHDLVPFDDPDDDTDIEFGQVIAGNLDHPWDTDLFNIELAEGDKIEITVESMVTDPVLVVDFAGSGFGDAQEDDNSGEGIFQTNAKLTYEAPHTGSFMLLVSDSRFSLTGSYFIEVTAPDAESQSEAYALSLVASADVQRRGDDAEKAIKLLTRAIELDSDLVSAYLGRAEAYTADEQLDLALADATSAVELTSEDPEPLVLRSTLYYELRDFENALMDLEQAKKLDPDYHDAHNMSALVQVGLGDLDAALADVNRALQLKKRDNSYIKDTRAYIYLKMGEYDKAFTAYRSISDDSDGDAYYELGLGLAYVGLEEPDRARKPLNDGLVAAEDFENPDPQLADLIAMAEAAADDL